MLLCALMRVSVRTDGMKHCIWVLSSRGWVMLCVGGMPLCACVSIAVADHLAGGVRLNGLAREIAMEDVHRCV